MSEKFLKVVIDNTDNTKTVKFTTLPKDEEEQVKTVRNMRLDNKISMEQFKDFDTRQDDGMITFYSVKIGWFIEWNDGEYTLEQTYDSLAEMYTDLGKYCIDEIEDGIPTAYIEERTEWENSYGADEYGCDKYHAMRDDGF